MSTPGRADIPAVAALEDPQRRRLYDTVRRAGRPVTREEAALAIGISRKLAAFHLDKLVAVGLLRVASGSRPGPRMVGRAPKRYEPGERTVAVSIPARSHDLLAAILVNAAATGRPDEPAPAARARAAAAEGRLVGASVEAPGRRGRLGAERAMAVLEAVLEEKGFEPYRPAPDRIRLRNCPFHPLAERAPGVVCGVNVAFLGGILDGIGITTLGVELAPAPGECCAEIHPVPPAAEEAAPAAG
ncbi:MAG TPA: helix-turn-helix domain-containing protein [Nocardioidaceae bacterium]|nr:helix-turn-helix domain-containing protein [Nocardioidaceae bacterium]